MVVLKVDVDKEGRPEAFTVDEDEDEDEDGVAALGFLGRPLIESWWAVVAVLLSVVAAAVGAGGSGSASVCLVCRVVTEFVAFLGCSVGGEETGSDAGGAGVVAAGWTGG